MSKITKKNNWHKIFGKNNKYIKYSISEYLAYSLFGTVHSFKENIEFFIDLTHFFSKNLHIKKKTSILDFGSGNGCFLYILIYYFKLKNNVSIEINKYFINFQKKYIPSTSFYSGGNTKSLKKLKDLSIDNILSSSVFQYFESDEDARDVLEEFIRICKKKILIYDVKNILNKKIYLKNIRNRQGLSSKEFNQKYKYSPIRFYKKIFFKKLKKNKNVKSIKILKMPKKSLDSKYSFCVLIEKK